MLRTICPSLFGGLDPTLTDAVASKMRLAEFRQRAAIFRAGDAADHFYVIISGHVRLTRMAMSGKEVATDVLGPGEVLGEATLLKRRDQYLTAHALDDVSAWAFSATDVLSVTKLDAQFGMNLAIIVHERLIRVSTALEDLACAQVSERLLNLFDRIAESHGTETTSGRYLGIELTHADIALLVGSSRETVSAMLGLLTRSGALRIERKKIVLAN